MKLQYDETRSNLAFKFKLRRYTVDAAERRALCSAKDRPDGARASVWGDIATVLGGSGATKHLKAKLKAKVGRCRLTVSKIELKSRLVSVLETNM